MDFAIAPVRHGVEETWDVICFAAAGEVERPGRLASFGYRGHAEAFLADLLSREDSRTGDGGEL